MKRKVNSEYLKPLLETPLYWALLAYGALRRDPAIRNKRILLVNPCTIGDFVSTLPSIHDFIFRHPEYHVDLVVSPPLVPLAHYVRGVKTIFTATSSIGRMSETGVHRRPSGAYERVVLMRASSDLFSLLGGITFGSFSTAVRPYSRYTGHVAWSIMRGKTPRRWMEHNFDVLGGTFRHIPFRELFDIPFVEYERVRALPQLEGQEQKIVIHTGVSWVMNRWGRSNWVALLRLLNAAGTFRFVFVGGLSEEDEYHAIAQELPFPTYSLIGEDLVTVLLALHMSDYFVGTDSGPRNMAHLVDTPSVVLLGPAPHMWTPPNPRDIVLDKSGGRYVSERLVQKRRALIDTITPEEVSAAFAALRARVE